MTAPLATSALAGPPYATDDPEPTPYGEVEAYLFSEGAIATGRFEEAGTGFEFNIGALPNLQLSSAITLDYGANSKIHVNVVELGAKYRFVEEDDDGWSPQVSFYPQAEISLDTADGEGPTRYLLPLWAQKSIGNWTVFGGGGYHINPGTSLRNAWLGGLAAEHELGNHLSAGAEVYGETGEEDDEPGILGIGLGLTWAVSEQFELLGSTGPVFAGRRTHLAYYVALGWHG